MNLEKNTEIDEKLEWINNQKILFPYISIGQIRSTYLLSMNARKNWNNEYYLDFETKELLFYHYIKISNISKKLNLLWVVRDRIIEGNFWRILWKMSGKKRQKFASYHYKRFHFLVIKEHKKYKKKLRKNYKIWSLKSQFQQVEKGGISLFLNSWLWDLNSWLWDISICFLFFYWFIELSCVYFDTYKRSPKELFFLLVPYISALTRMNVLKKPQFN